MYQNDTLPITDSRTGSIVDLTQMANGNFCATSKNSGNYWMIYEIMQDGKAVVRALVKADVVQCHVSTWDVFWWGINL